ncbi:hypothetical protein CANINC_002332 [Pichia inconspicua]|uniref:histidine kinase n=1 Tax=Pichia inconspicua TaxID=52247 RepID=A0A4T0X2V7_9ASCO|nr:hypothetical protein CANINC_002332 [[Candida] inconspicua]
MLIHKHRLRVSIRTQLIALLEVIAELRSSQLVQSMDQYYFQLFQLSEKQAVQRALTIRKAGNTSSSALENAQLMMQQTIESTTYLASAKLYDLNFNPVVYVENPFVEKNASTSTLSSLYILDTQTKSSSPQLPDGLLQNRGYLEGPVLDDNDYFISLSLPVYANESILVPQQFVAGYLSVIVDLKVINDSITDGSSGSNQNNNPNSEYSSINYISPIHPYNNLTNYTGFFYAFQNKYLIERGIEHGEVFNISSYLPADDVFDKGELLGTYVNIKNPYGLTVSLGFSKVNLDYEVWLVVVEQIQSEFKKPVTNLIKIMVGLCIGLAAAMCLITFPLAHYGVRPILKLQKATEEITYRRGLKKKRRKNNSGNPFRNIQTFLHTHFNDGSHSPGPDGPYSPDGGQIDEKLTLEINNQSSMNNDYSHSSQNTNRYSWSGSYQSPSSIDSFSNTTQESMDFSNPTGSPSMPIVPTRGIFYDELTELTEAFNAMTLELDKQYTHLEDRVKARTKELELAKVQADAARQQAEKANEAKTVFIANISHELRTPLNGILGMTSVAMSERDIDKIQNSLELIFRSGELLLHILIQLLTFSKNQLDKSKLQKKNFLVIEVASQIKSIFGKTAKDQNVNLVITLKPNILRHIILFGDSNRIIQVVMNLVSNSLKFTPENGTVRVLIELLGEYDLERSQKENFEKVFIVNKDKDANSYHVKPIEEEFEHIEEIKSDTSSSVSIRSNSTLSTLRSSVYHKSLADLYKTTSCETKYFADDGFYEEPDIEDIDSRHKSHIAHKFGESINKQWVIRFSVTDTGTGIEKSLQDKIFDAFVQGDQTLSRSHGGTGLGLSICKQFAKMMHGTITLDSEVGKGSTFTFIIPLPQVGEILIDGEELEEFYKDDFNEKYNRKKKVKFMDTSAGDSIIEELRNDDDKDDVAIISRINNKKDSMTLASSYKSEDTVGELVHKSSKSDLDNNSTRNYDKPELITRASTGTAQSYRSKRSESSSESILQRSDNPNTNLKLLVAEDNLVNQEVVKRMLRLEGISNIALARDGEDAVQFVKECITNDNKPFDLILMDVQMPNLDGLSATKIIREELHYAGPIVALTAFADISNEKGCIDAGMSGFLSKPIRRNLLKNIIREFCQKDTSDES